MIGRSWVTREVVHALWLGQASWVTRKVVCMHVVAVFQIVHELWVVSHESFTCFTTSAFTLYTYYIELSTEGHTVFLFNWNTITIQYFYIQYNTIQYLDNLECSNRMLVPELDLIIAGSWNRQNDVTVTLNIARKKWKFWKKRSLRVQTSCKDFDQIGIQQPDACTWAELKFKFWRGLTRNSRVEFHSNLRGRYPPWTSKGSPTFVKNLRNVI